MNISLCLLSGILLGLSYPPAGPGILALIGFVPLLLVLSGDESFSDVFRHAYGAFFVFNLITLYWPGGFVHMRDPYLMVSGILLLLAHPIFMSLPILAWHSIRKTLGIRLSLAALPFIWVGFEYAHSATQLSFPWLALGYSMSYDPGSIQIASLAGIYAVTFWIVLLNVLFFFLITEAMVRGRSIPAGFMRLAAVILVVYALPYGYGMIDDGKKEAADGRPLRVALVQPDIDPFEKWEKVPAGQVDLLRRYTDSLVTVARPDIVIWPETAVPYYILSRTYAEEFRELKKYVDSTGIPLLSGIPDIVMYGDSSRAPSGAKRLSDGTYYETFNSSMLLIPGSREIQKFAKAILVPFAERVPFSDFLGFLNAARWNFGLGGWSEGRDTALYRLPVGGNDTLRFANMICYESVYPGYVAGLVHRGAGFLTVVTNDSWWGNTSGPYQHRQFGVVRAVENRRWVAQCANGGISFLIDPSGRVVKETAMFTAGGVTGTIRSRTDESFYSRHGDWLAEFCLALSLFLFAGTWLQRRFRARMKSGEMNPAET